jgi:spermidine/putrescine transport system permease protein
MNKHSKISRNGFVAFLKRWYIFLVLALIYVPLIFIVMLSFNEPTARGNIDLNFGTPTFVNYLNL